MFDMINRISNVVVFSLLSFFVFCELFHVIKNQCFKKSSCYLLHSSYLSIHKFSMTPVNATISINCFDHVQYTLFAFYLLLLIWPIGPFVFDINNNIDNDNETKITVFEKMREIMDIKF